MLLSELDVTFHPLNGFDANSSRPYHSSFNVIRSFATYSDISKQTYVPQLLHDTRVPKLETDPVACEVDIPSVHKHPHIPLKELLNIIPRRKHMVQMHTEPRKHVLVAFCDILWLAGVKVDAQSMLYGGLREVGRDVSVDACSVSGDEGLWDGKSAHWVSG